jgi:thiol:disulfide interchange protein
MPMKKICTFFAGGLLALVFGAGLLPGQDDPFDLKFQAKKENDDPFALQNKLEAAPSPENPKKDPFDLSNKAGPRSSKEPQRKTGGVADRIDFEVSVAPKVAAPGQTVKLTITGILKPSFHTFAFTQRTPKQNIKGRTISVVEINKVPGIKRLWPMVETAPEAFDLGDGPNWGHFGKFTLSQDILILPDAGQGAIPLSLEIKLQVCDEHSCLPGTIPLQVSIQVKGKAIPLSAELKKRLEEKEPEVAVIQPKEKDIRVVGPARSTTNTGLLGFILTGIFWGAVSLITPCVFPMIPITVSYFLKQSEKEHHKPITMALVYCATIIVVLTIAAVALLSFFRGLSTNPIMNYVIGGLFIFFALSLFGMYDIELPSGLARFTSAREGKGGLVGTMFMALTFTIISFACVAPFLGGFGGTAAGSNMTWVHRVLGGLAFSVTFASPFFILALFPTLLKKMPKSGSWLNTVKVVMGFLELAAAFKFLRTAELVSSSKPAFFTYDFVLGIYIALSLLTGLYLLNLYRLPHDTPEEHLSVPRLLFSLMFIGLAFYLTPALFKSDKGNSQRPAGVIFAWLDSFLLPEEQESDLPWGGDLLKGLADAKTKRKLVFVDFTGVSCTNCKLNERDVFPNPLVKEFMKQYELVALYTDKVPDKFYPPKVRAKLNGVARQHEDAQKNLQFQRNEFNTESLPLYVILQPQADGGYRELARYEGRILDQGEFVDFLEKPLEAISKRNGGGRTAGLSWSGNLQEGLKWARSAKKRVFLYFNALSNTNCLLNERAFVKPEIKDLLEKFGRVELYVDKVPAAYYSPEVRSSLGSSSRQRDDAEKNLQFQVKKFETYESPLYVILEPLPRGDFRELARWGGRITQEGEADFRQFLANPEKEIARR